MIALRREAVDVVGPAVEIARVDLRGRGPARVFLKNRGEAALGPVRVSVAPNATEDEAVLVDDAALSALEPGASAQVRVAAPIGRLILEADEDAGPTSVDVSVLVADDGRGEDRG